MSPRKIRALRRRENVTCEVLARHMYITTKLVRQWESGDKRPLGAALKLLTLIDHKGLSAIS